MVECESLFYKEVKMNGLGFNRYMVECEFLTPQSFGEEQLVLIDTWWNVNNV